MEEKRRPCDSLLIRDVFDSALKSRQSSKKYRDREQRAKLLPLLEGNRDKWRDLCRSYMKKDPKCRLDNQAKFDDAHNELFQLEERCKDVLDISLARSLDLESIDILDSLSNCLGECISIRDMIIDNIRKKGLLKVTPINIPPVRKPTYASII